jgi:Flp pilus assembly protein TadD
VVNTFRLLLGVIMLALLPACQLINLNPGFEPDPELERQVLGDTSQAIPDPQLLQMTPELQRYLEAHVPANLSGWNLVSRLQELLFSEDYLNIVYDESANLTATGVFEQRQANCLSLVGLYITMARHYGLDANYQTVQVRPVWDRRGSLLVLSEHVNAIGRLNSTDRYIVDFTPEVRLQHNTARIVSDQQARALYFNNMAVESLIAGDLQLAREYARFAVRTDSELDLAWNTLGSILNRLDEPELAEYSYQKSAWLNRNNASVINNLARFYAAQGDDETAERYRRAVESYNQRNPYYHYSLGGVAFEGEQYQDALAHFQQAIRRNDLEPDFYFALGVTYRELGEDEMADQVLQLAAAMRELGDQVYRPTQDRVRRIDGRSILRSSSAGFTVEFVD